MLLKPKWTRMTLVKIKLLVFSDTGWSAEVAPSVHQSGKERRDSEGEREIQQGGERWRERETGKERERNKSERARKSGVLLSLQQRKILWMLSPCCDCNRVERSFSSRFFFFFFLPCVSVFVSRLSFEHLYNLSPHSCLCARCSYESCM